MSIWEALYNGELYPGEEIVPRNPGYSALGEKIGKEREYFKSKLSPEDKERFEEWDGLLLTSSSMNSYANFSYGVKLGVLLMCEVFNGDDRPGVQD